jgi:hypothetical protein
MHPTPLLLVSHGLELLPLANRLQRQGVDVALHIHRDRFKEGWGPTSLHSLPTNQLEVVAREVMAGTRHLIATHRRILPPILTPIPEGVMGMVGGDVPGGREHGMGLLLQTQVGDGEPDVVMVVGAMGAWDGGKGPGVWGGALAVRLAPDHPLHKRWGSMATAVDTPTYYPLLPDPDGGPPTLELGEGWAFPTRSLLFNLMMEMGDGEQFGMVLPLSLAPWPTIANTPSSADLPLTLPDAAWKHLHLHDVRVDPDRREVVTGGRDGLVGVAVAAGNLPHLLTQQVVAVAGMVARQIPGLQWRGDVGDMWGDTLAGVVGWPPYPHESPDGLVEGKGTVVHGESAGGPGAVASGLTPSTQASPSTSSGTTDAI